MTKFVPVYTKNLITQKESWDRDSLGWQMAIDPAN